MISMMQEINWTIRVHPTDLKAVPSPKHLKSIPVSLHIHPMNLHGTAFDLIQGRSVSELSDY
ncbi:hypothetical protein sscle_01g002140 [Sclerotinia sclerotiorum 1980 UF-70]|uniref:Uncharacterized protein n=1 Tax=Sclerotinia sclerotiorum (strain ATCC 18683 / 1980 / Ss-1) TaxID=665079 RepID=A0A1D9PRW9_SCLS1|nr:hypothetical protein sscle_01g002140 [Sclerotinia sclerotiorum 1980 UF-70]